MRFLVIGCGSIGERHTKNLLSLGQEVWVYDRDLSKMESLIDKYQVRVYDFISHHLLVDAFVICTPPIYHLPFAFEALSHNSHIFIEKPISHNLDSVEDLIGKAKSGNRILQVGYQFRFHSGLRLAKRLLDEGRIGKLLSIQATFGQYLPDWHPHEDYRNLYTSHEDQGGGILLDSSHEVDYCRWLSGSEIIKVACFAGKLGSLDVDVEDTAAILLLTSNNCIIDVCTDFNNRIYTRNCRLVGEKGTIIWDYKDTTLQMFNPKEHNIFFNDSDMYLEEMKSFISCIERKEKPIVDGEVGKRILEITLSAKESAKENKVMGV